MRVTVGGFGLHYEYLSSIWLQTYSVSSNGFNKDQCNVVLIIEPLET